MASTSRYQDLGHQIPLVQHRTALDSLSTNWNKRLQSQQSDLESHHDKQQQDRLRECGIIESEDDALESRNDALMDRYDALVGQNCELQKKHYDLQDCDCDQGDNLGDARGQALLNHTELIWMEQNFNLCGAMEHIVYQARLEKQISCLDGIQAGLDELAQGTDFKKALEKEVQVRKLVGSEVMACIHNLYDQVSKLASGNDCRHILVPADKFTPNQVAALVTFLRMQKTWAGSLQWIEG